MKNTSSLFLALFVLAASASCTKAELEGNVPSGKTSPARTITLGIVSDEAKSYIDGKSICWELGQNVAVYYDDEKNPVKFTVVEADGNKAVISGDAPDETPSSIYAVFPYKAAGVAEGGRIAIDFPSEQVVDSHNTGAEALVSIAHVSSSDEVLSFRNLSSLARITLSDSSIRSVTLTSGGGEAICGAVTTDVTASSTVTDGASSIILKASAGTLAAGDYYMALLPSTLEKGFSLLFEGASGKAYRKTAKQAEFKRNGGLNLGNVTDGLVWVPYEITTFAQLKAWEEISFCYAPGETISLESDIDCGGNGFGPVHGFLGNIDGKGHALKNLKTSTAICDTIPAGSEVRNLIFDSSCHFTFPAGSDANAGLLANVVYGKVSSVICNASFSMPSYTYGYRGCIIGRAVSGSVIEGCTNNSTVTFSGSRTVNGTLYLAGIAGRADGQITNCTNTGAICLNIIDDSSSNSWHIAGITASASSAATVSDCGNTGDIIFTTRGCNGKILLGGIASYSESQISTCTNGGTVSVVAETSSGAHDGSVRSVGVAGISAFQSRQICGCTNTGAVSLSAGSFAGVMTVGKMEKFATVAGGIVAMGCTDCTVSGCINEGPVASRMYMIDKCASGGYTTAARHAVAGIIASSYGNVEDCGNSGGVTACWVTSTHNAALAKNFVTMAGGISGGDYHSTQTCSNVSGCLNTGDVDITCDASGSNSAIGGIVGWPGKENVSCTNIISDCVNEGDVTVSGFSKSRVGGIIGGACELEGCFNSGKVWYKSGLTSSSVGGLCGFQVFKNVSGCTNKGVVRSDVAIAGAHGGAVSGVGGLVGSVGNSPVTFSACQVDCNVTASSRKSASMLIGFIDNDKEASVNALYVGTASAPITVGGSFNSTPVTESNYKTYIVGSDYTGVNPKVEFHTQFSSGDDPAEGSGEGFSDGGQGTWK